MYSHIKLKKYSVIKFVKEQKKSRLKYYQMVLYAVKMLLPIKDMLRTIPVSGVNNYIKIKKEIILEKEL